MTVYYNSQESGVLALLRFRATILSFVLTRSEFWVLLGFHTLLVLLAKMYVDPEQVQTFKWEAASVMQYFMTFFITFYNDKCFSRYMMELYPSCCAMMDKGVHFCLELNIDLCHPSLEKHRTQMTKYVLAMIHEYFMIVTGGKLSKDSWKYLVKKGLLTRNEAEMMQYYPGDRGTNALMCWCHFVLKDALKQDFFHEGRKQTTEHLYARISQHLNALLLACNNISYVVALPIPFSYYHLMNATLFCNILLLATVPALFGTFLTVPLFSLALLMTMGIKDISTAMADPFGEDSLDFPVPCFVNQVFSRCACLILSFHDTRVRDSIVSGVGRVDEFTDKQLGRQLMPDVLYSVERHLRSSKKDTHQQGSFSWMKPNIFHILPDEVDAQLCLRETLLAPGEETSPEEPVEDWERIERERKEEEVKQQILAQCERGEELRAMLADVKAQLHELRLKEIGVQE